MPALGGPPNAMRRAVSELCSACLAKPMQACHAVYAATRQLPDRWPPFTSRHCRPPLPAPHSLARQARAWTAAFE